MVIPSAPENVPTFEIHCINGTSQTRMIRILVKSRKNEVFLRFFFTFLSALEVSVNLLIKISWLEND